LLNRTEAVECRFRRLSDAVFADSSVNRVALLKIDVEGAELDVLRGVEPAHWARIDQVAMEVENEELTQQVTTLLEGAGFYVRSWVSDDMATLLPTSEVRQLLAKRRPVPRAGATDNRSRSGRVARSPKRSQRN
jgi:hypothetical protein